MQPDANPDTSALDADAERIEAAVRQLVLMKETGPKSAAWHRARVQTIWRLQRTLALLRDQQHSKPTNQFMDQIEP